MNRDRMHVNVSPMSLAGKTKLSIDQQKLLDCIRLAVIPRGDVCIVVLL